MSFAVKIAILAIIAIAAMVFGSYGLFEESAARPPAATPKPDATSTAKPTATSTASPTTTAKPGTTTTTTPATTTTKPTTTTTPATTPATTAVPKPTGSAKMLNEWKGTANLTTPAITIAAGAAPWAVSWSNNPTMVAGESIGSLRIVVRDAKGTSVAVITNSTKREANFKTVEQSGTFTLQITAIDTQWIVQAWSK
ncbi:MAG: hypothetical protein HYX79_02900 [Chloroflexi bacterium]|nr:hypothetical protein [Chloroflexota bacterium]